MIRIVSCAQCNTEHELEIKPEDWQKWRDGELIQRAMPYLTAEQRELLISQTCGACWSEMFDGSDEE